jgi:rubrerythrin
MYNHYQNSDPLSRVYMEESINIIKTSIQQEQTNVKLYLGIWNLVDKDEKELISKIISDEKEHVQSLRWLHMALTKKSLTVDDSSVVPALAIIPAIKKCISIEIATIENYNKVYNHLNEKNYKNILSKLIYDELKNFNILNYLLINRAAR